MTLVIPKVETLVARSPTTRRCSASESSGTQPEALPLAASTRLGFWCPPGADRAVERPKLGSTSSPRSSSAPSDETTGTSCCTDSSRTQPASTRGLTMVERSGSRSFRLARARRATTSQTKNQLPSPDRSGGGDPAWPVGRWNLSRVGVGILLRLGLWCMWVENAYARTHCLIFGTVRSVLIRRVPLHFSIGRLVLMPVLAIEGSRYPSARPDPSRRLVPATKQASRLEPIKSRFRVELLGEARQRVFVGEQGGLQEILQVGG